MPHTLINPNDSIGRQNEKLLRITETLMRRVEQATDASGAAYAQFQRAALLEEEVRARTRDLEHALDLLNDSNAQLAIANRETEAARANLTNAIETVQEGFALFNADDEMVMCNSRFGMHMPDIRDRMKPGLPFATYVDMISNSAFLSLPPDVTAADWAAARMARHMDDRVVFNVRMTGRRWVQVSEHRTPDGGTVVLQTDVTEIMRIERQARDRIVDDQARLIRATLEHLRQGVCIFDNQGLLVGWNHRVRELLSLPIGRFHAGSAFSSVFDQMRDEFSFAGGAKANEIADWAAGPKGRAPLSFEIRHGQRRILAVFMQEMPNRGFVISFTDVTAEKAAVQSLHEVNETLEQRVLDRTLELEDALAEAERANASKSRFVAAASHDLLQPLSAAKLYLNALQGAALEAGPREAADKAGNALQSVENILGALLDISKLDSGKASALVTSVPLGVMLDQLHDELAPLAAGKGLDFRVVGTSVNVRSDATYLQRILQNLVSNAIRYTPQGRVLVGVRREQNAVRIEVRDTGPGIPEEEEDRIFDEFQRLNATASAADGMGLGLAIVERACALLNHPLQMTSQIGQGTVFSVTVPLARANTSRQVPSVLATSGARVTDRIVLLIENDIELRNALALTMEGWGVNVLPCADASQARALIDDIDIPPDAIIADYRLDNGQLGTDAIAGLRARFGTDMAPIPAMVISAERDPALSQTCSSIGVRLHHKPVDPKALLRFLLTTDSDPPVPCARGMAQASDA